MKTKTKIKGAKILSMSTVCYRSVVYNRAVERLISFIHSFRYQSFQEKCVRLLCGLRCCNAVVVYFVVCVVNMFVMKNLPQMVRVQNFCSKSSVGNVLNTNHVNCHSSRRIKRTTHQCRNNHRIVYVQFF